MSTITQTISAIPQGGQRGVQTRDAFVASQEAFQDHLHDNFDTEVNTFITQTNLVAGEVTTARNESVSAKNDAQTASSVSQASANYKGTWSSLTGALSVPSSVAHNGSFWLLNVNVADITLSEPTNINTDWTKIENNNLTNPSITGSITEQSAVLPALALDPANGTVQYTTLTADTTLTDSLLDGQFMLLEVTYATFTLTLPTSTAINTLPDGSNTTDFYLFFKRGTTLYVSYSGGIK